jgi:hypothetical protein
MTEHSEHPPEGAAAPGDRTSPAGGSSPPAAAEGEAGDRPVAAEPYASEPYAAEPPKAARSNRFRRWSASAPIRLGAVALVAGLVGGLVGGGIVAAFSDDGRDGGQKVRVERGMPWGGPGFRAPRYWNPGGGWVQPDPRQPMRRGQPVLPKPPVQPSQAVTPSPTATG